VCGPATKPVVKVPLDLRIPFVPYAPARTAGYVVATFVGSQLTRLWRTPSVGPLSCH